MTRTTSPRKTKRRTLLNSTKGYKKPANNHFKIAHQRFLKAQVHAFRDRHNKKRVFRHLWIGRLNAFLRNSFGISVRAQFNGRNIIYEFFKSKCLWINFLSTSMGYKVICKQFY